jgi:hypothetical protein
MSAHVIAHLGLIDEEAIALDLAALELAALDHPGVDLDPIATISTGSPTSLPRSGAAPSGRRRRRGRWPS